MTDRLNDEFLERVGPTLRRAEPLDPGLIARVMSEVRAESTAIRDGSLGSQLARNDGHGWWRRRRAFEVSPLAALALAASFAGIVCLGTLGAAGALKWMGNATSPTSVAAVAAETVHVVRFTFASPGARSVSLVGDFNAWAKDATPLVEMGEDGAWSVSVALRPGRHEYAFIVDGREWIADPFAVRVNDEFGTESSVLVVGESSHRQQANRSAERSG